MPSTEGRVRVARLPPTTGRNPYQRQLYDALAHHRVDLVGDGELHPTWLHDHRDCVEVLHLHWRLDRLVDRSRSDDLQRVPRPTSAVDALDSCRALAEALALARSLGYVIAWTVHEPSGFTSVADPFEQVACRVVAQLADLVFTHDEASAAVASPWLRDGVAPVVTPLGHYGDVYPDADDGGVDVQDQLGIDPGSHVFLCFGHHRRDKELDLLLDAFGALERDDAVLVVAGRNTEPGSAARLARESRGDRRIRVIADHVDERDVRSLFATADVAVLARSIDWTPSSLVLALSLGVPTVAADLPTAHEHLGPGSWYFAPGDVDSLTATLAATMDREDLAARSEAGQIFVGSRTWGDMAAVTAAAMHAVVDGSRVP